MYVNGEKSAIILKILEAYKSRFKQPTTDG